MTSDQLLSVCRDTQVFHTSLLCCLLDLTLNHSPQFKFSLEIESQGYLPQSMRTMKWVLWEENLGGMKLWGTQSDCRGMTKWPLFS